MARCPKCGKQWEGGLSFCPEDGATLPYDDDDPTVAEPATRQARVTIPDPGAVLGDKYRLELVIGKGGMGVVFKARHLRIDRDVAIKILRPDVVGNPTQVARFAEEARLAGSIGHDGIVEILDLVTPPDEPPYIVMEYLEGQSLRDLLRTTPRLEPSRAVKVAVDVLEALAAAHRREIIHRDVKPGNVHLARKEGRGEVVKLLDFGVARAVRKDFRLTSPGKAVGTAQYMPPEQMMAGDVDERADIYAVAALLFSMVAGEPPFVGDNWADLATRKVKGTARRLSEVLEVPPKLDDAVARGLSKNPEDRPATANDFISELQEALDQAKRRRKGTPTDLPTLQMRRKERVAVLPFAVETGKKTDSWLGHVLAMAVTEELMLRPGQRVVDPRYVAAAVRGQEVMGPTGPAALGPDLGADAVISGVVREDGRKLEVALTLHDGDSSEEVDTARVKGPRNKIVSLVAGVADSLDGAINIPPLPESLDEPLARRDADAFRQYVELSSTLVKAEGDPSAAAAMLPEIDWAMAEYPEDFGLRRLRAAAMLENSRMAPRRSNLAQAQKDLEDLSAAGYGDPWIPAARASLRVTEELWDPKEALVFCNEARVMNGPDARVQLVEATALENQGLFDRAASALSAILDHSRFCGPALLRFATLELSPTRVAQESLERAAFVLRSAQRLRGEEQEEGVRAASARHCWAPLPDLWALEAILCVRRGDAEGAAAVVDAAPVQPPKELIPRLYALSARDFVAVALGLRPRGKPGLLLGLMGQVRRAFAGPSNHAIHELAVCVPDVWIPVLGAHLDERPEDLRIRLLRAMVLDLDGDYDEAMADVKDVLGSTPEGVPLHEAAEQVADIIRG